MTSSADPDFATRRFKTAAAHYLAGRPAYPAALAARLAALLPIAPHDRLIDLGCGPANLALAFAPYAREILAIDPEPAMRAIAGQAVAGTPQIQVIAGSAAELSPALGPARAVLIGRAFHWMDRADTLRRLDGIVAPGGAVVLFDDQWPDLPQNAWRQDYAAVVRRYASDDADRTRRKSAAFGPHSALLLDSPFSEIETLGLLVRNPVHVETLVDRALSQSSTSAARLGARAETMVAEIRAACAAWPAPEQVEIVSWTATIARRP